MITPIIIVVAICIAVVLTTWYLIVKQTNFVIALQPGDKISLNGDTGEIVERLGANDFIVKIRVSGMKLSKPKK